jgi:hypothetical protein
MIRATVRRLKIARTTPAITLGETIPRADAEDPCAEPALDVIGNEPEVSIDVALNRNEIRNDTISR